MLYVGADLHKKSISLCVVKVENGKQRVLRRQTVACRQTDAIRRFFAGLGPFRLAVEATAAYEWLFQLIEDLAERLVLVHPKKLRVIAESTRKTDKIDAYVLALFLALDMLPEAYRPSPRVREHRTLVRHRHYVQGRITSVKCKLRHKLAQYNEDIVHLFSRAGREHLRKVAMSAADRFEVEQLVQQLEFFQEQLVAAERALIAFGQQAPPAEQQARKLLDDMPQIGDVTVNVVLSELGDWRRFRSAKRAVAYAGLAPGVRQSGSRRHDLHITKEGSRLLRLALVEAAWRLVGFRVPGWCQQFIRLQKRTGSEKKAIVALSRRLLCVMFAMLRSGQPYRPLAAAA